MVPLCQTLVGKARYTTLDGPGQVSEERLRLRYHTGVTVAFSRKGGFTDFAKRNRRALTAASYFPCRRSQRL